MTLPPPWLADYEGLDLDEARARAESEGRPYRVIGPDSVVTLDIRTDRLNLHVDEHGALTDLRAG